jgi:hypothetical protein
MIEFAPKIIFCHQGAKAQSNSKKIELLKKVILLFSLSVPL